MSIFTRKFLYILPCLALLYNTVQAQTANFTASPTTGCAPLVVQFTNTSTGTNSATVYDWNLGNNVHSALANPSTSYSTPGTYTVSLTVRNGSNANTKTITGYITVNPSPQVQFTANNTFGCPGTTIQFTNQTIFPVGVTGTYYWSFGDGQSSTAQSPAHIYTTPGNYNVTLKVTNSFGCSQTLTDTNYIHIYTPPGGNFTASSTFFCKAPATDTFTATGTGTGPYTYDWSYGDNTTGTGAVSAHTYTTPGTYTVKVIITDAHGCKDTVSKTGYVTIGNMQPAFTGPAAACVNTQVSFTNTTSGPAPASAVWNFGDNTGIFIGVNATHTYTAAGTYTVKMTATSPNNCVDSTVRTIVINPAPVLGFTYSPTAPCPSPATIQFTNTSSSGGNFNWTFSDGGTSTATSPSHTFHGDSAYTVKLSATTAAGCKDSITQTVTVYNLFADIYASRHDGCAPLTVKFKGFAQTHTTPPDYTTINPYPYSIASYVWNFGDGTGNSTLDSPVHIFVNPGTYWVKVTITTVNGCTHTDSTLISAGSHPTAAFTAAPTTTCFHDPVQFTNNSTNATVYIWNFDDGGTTSVPSPKYHFSAPGIWGVTLIALNNGCADTMRVDSMITVLPSKSLATFAYHCDTPAKVTFTNASIGDSSHVWIFGDGTTSTAGPIVSHTYPALGNYTALLATYNSTNGCRDTVPIPLQLYKTIPIFTSADTAICKGDQVIFSAGNVPNIIKYNWVIGTNYYPDTTATIPYTFTQRGYYTVKLITKNTHLCIDTFTRVNYQLVSDPAVNIVGTPLVGCTPLAVNFTDSSTGLTGTYFTSKQWVFGDGFSNTSMATTNSHTYTTAGIYDVKLFITDNVGCTDSMVRTGYINAQHPVANFMADDTTVCIGQTVTFTDLTTSPGATLSYQWTFGDGTSGTGPQPAHSYTATGSYTVKLIVTNATGCKDSITKTAYIKVLKPHASFTASDSVAICPPLIVSFNSTSANALSYAWNFGNNASAVIPNPSNAFNNAGVYNVRLIVTNSEGCTDTAYKQIKVLGYAGALTYTPLSGCVPLTVNFTASITNVPSLIWDFSDGTTAVATTSTTSHIYTFPGAFVPKLIISDGAGCLTTSTGLDTIKADGVDAGFTATDPACIHSSILFTDTSYSPFSPITTSSWTFHNGQTAFSHQTSHTYDTTGTYAVTLISVNAHGCRDTVIRSVTILPLPVISAGKDTVICKGDVATLQPSGGVSYVWDISSSLSCSGCTNPQANPVVPTDYYVTGTGANGCTSKDTVNVSLKTKTVASAGNGGEICYGQSFQLQAIGGQRYLWSPAATLNNSQVINPVAAPVANTTYTLITWEGSCIPDTDYVTVVVHPLPKVDAGADQKVVAGSSAVLVATGTGAKYYTWAPPETLSCDSCSSPKASPLKTTTYTVTAHSDYGCVDSDSVHVIVLCDQSQVFIPNSFTPNGDGHNDYFYPRGKGIDKVKSFRVYNRWGEVVYEHTGFELNDKTQGWDGTYKGEQLRTDVFVYVIEAICDNGETISWKGDVSLVR
ncbi:PKD domain-containing protein [Chitinophagaceae bacterium MMS25-I14]